MKLGAMSDAKGSEEVEEERTMHDAALGVIRDGPHERAIIERASPVHKGRETVKTLLGSRQFPRRKSLKKSEGKNIPNEKIDQLQSSVERSIKVECTRVSSRERKCMMWSKFCSSELAERHWLDRHLVRLNLRRSAPRYLKQRIGDASLVELFTERHCGSNN